ncbi:MAG: DinB family protein [Anaerolineales bacterium]|nr:DinB family protein [Anaerolineales bacterium]
MTESIQYLSERLRKEGGNILSFFQTLSDHQLQVVIYTEGADWNVRDVLAHFVSSEESLVGLFKEILEGSPGVDDDFSIDRYNQSQIAKLENVDRAELLDAFSGVRTATIEWVFSLSEEDLRTTGRHPFLGVTTLAEMIKLLYRHNQIHYRDLRSVLGGNS